MTAMVNDPPSRSAAVRASPRILVRGDWSTARWIGALSLLCVSGWVLVLAAQQHRPADWQGGLGFSVAALAATTLIAPGIVLGRPVTTLHAATAAVVVGAGVAAHVLSLDLVGIVLACRRRLAADMADHGATPAGRAAPDMGAGGRHAPRSAGAVRDGVTPSRS